MACLLETHCLDSPGPMSPFQIKCSNKSKVILWFTCLVTWVQQRHYFCDCTLLDRYYWNESTCYLKCFKDLKNNSIPKNHFDAMSPLQFQNIPSFRLNAHIDKSHPIHSLSSSQSPATATKSNCRYKYKLSWDYRHLSSKKHTKHARTHDDEDDIIGRLCVSFSLPQRQEGCTDKNTHHVFIF